MSSARNQVKKKQEKIQIGLLIIGIFLILATYFYYPYINKNKSTLEENIVEGLKDSSENSDERSTSFESIKYEGLYNLDKTYTVTSKKAYINNEEPDIVYMTDMEVILYLRDGRTVKILSDKGYYNKSNYDCFFENNVKATDGGTNIFSDNLELLGNESSVKIYNNVVINYPTGSILRADKIDYDFEKKYFKVSMFDDKRIKMKIFK